MKLEFSRQIFENTQISTFVTIRPMGAELFDRTDGQTDKQSLFAILRERLKTEAITVYRAAHFTYTTTYLTQTLVWNIKFFGFLGFR
jgi:hypothetical protein